MKGVVSWPEASTRLGNPLGHFSDPHFPLSYLSFLITSPAKALCDRLLLNAETKPNHGTIQSQVAKARQQIIV